MPLNLRQRYGTSTMAKLSVKGARCTPFHDTNGCAWNWGPKITDIVLPSIRRNFTHSWDNDRNMMIRGRRFLHLAPSKGRAKHRPNVCQSSAEGNMTECWRVLAPLDCRSILDEVSRTSANRNRRTQLTMDAMGMCVFVRVYVLVY